jgi:glycerol-3-phosphate dehydrogenase (NAD(P)+)
MKIAIFGSGSWATAIVKIACETHKEVFWWVREEEIVEGVKAFGYNPLYLSQCELDKNKITIDSDIKKIILAADNLLFVIPSAFFARSLKGLTSEDFKDKNIISATKGIVPETNQIVAEYMRDTYNISYANQAVISGPSHAEEIAKESLTYLTVGSKNPLLAKHLADNFNCRYVKTTISTDIEGIEYVGILKNIYALAVGICKGLGSGDNFISVVVANGLQEMENFLSICSPLEERNINNLAYLGDLLVTCYSQHSRNRTFGQMIGSGYSVNSAQLEMKMVAEGYYAANCIHELNKTHNAEIPIADAVYRILYKTSSARKEFAQLLEIFQ